MSATRRCAALTGCDPLVKGVADLAGTPVRFSERIVYSNSPGGGAVFHHDSEPDQVGVVYGQLAGETAWLALPKRELAAAVAAHGGVPEAVTEEAALRALDVEDAPELAPEPAGAAT